jgi:hypothetical protein
MVDWPIPKTMKALRGFLRLTGYYKKFIKGYGQIVAPLIDLLKKDLFGWNDKAKAAFLALKQVVSNPHVLTLLDFTKPFVVECDASRYGIGVVLMQNNIPISSQPRTGKSLFLSTYEKKLLPLVSEVKNRGPTC